MGADPPPVSAATGRDHGVVAAAGGVSVRVACDDPMINSGGREPRQARAVGGEGPGKENSGPVPEDGAAVLSQPDVHPKGFEPLTF